MAGALAALEVIKLLTGLAEPLAGVLLVIGFAYYIQHTAKRRGWFTPKYIYSTSLNSAAASLGRSSSR